WQAAPVVLPPPVAGLLRPRRKQPVPVRVFAGPLVVSASARVAPDRRGARPDRILQPDRRAVDAAGRRPARGSGPRVLRGSDGPPGRCLERSGRPAAVDAPEKAVRDSRASLRPLSVAAGGAAGRKDAPRPHAVASAAYPCVRDSAAQSDERLER